MNNVFQVLVSTKVGQSTSDETSAARRTLVDTSTWNTLSCTRGAYTPAVICMA